MVGHVFSCRSASRHDRTIRVHPSSALAESPLRFLVIRGRIHILEQQPVRIERPSIPRVRSPRGAGSASPSVTFLIPFSSAERNRRPRTVYDTSRRAAQRLRCSPAAPHPHRDAARAQQEIEPRLREIRQIAGHDQDSIGSRTRAAQWQCRPAGPHPANHPRQRAIPGFDTRSAGTDDHRRFASTTDSTKAGRAQNQRRLPQAQAALCRDPCGAFATRQDKPAISWLDFADSGIPLSSTVIMILYDYLLTAT